MGMDCTYFLAPDEVTAATFVAAPVSGTGVLAAETGFEPVVQGGRLWALLVGRPFDETLRGGGPEPLAMSEDGQSLVLKVSPGFVRALADTDMNQLRTVATDWANAAEFGGLFGAAELADQAVAVAKLSRKAVREDQSLYCHWLV